VQLLDGVRKRGGDVGHQRRGVHRVSREARARAGVLEDPVDKAPRPHMGLTHALKQLLVLCVSAVRQPAIE
jgi:hypothetical protein